MLIRSSWGSGRKCMIGTRISIGHEIITNFLAPVFQDGMHSNKWSEIIIHISGDVSYRTPSCTYEADTLDIFSIDSNETYNIEWHRTQPYERFAFYFDNDIFEDIFPEEVDYKAILSFLDHKKSSNLLKLSDEHKDELTSILNLMDSKLGSNDSDAKISVYTCFIRIFELIFRAGNMISYVPSHSQKTLVSKAVLFIDMHFKEITELSIIAEELHVNSEYLSKKFKAQIGVSIKNYLLDKKLQYTRHLLKLGYNVTETSNAAGFTNSSYFIRLYKKKYGITPGKE